MIINLTNNSKEEFKRLQEEKDEKQAIRIYMTSQGWGGPSFDIALDEQNDDDMSMDVDGLNFVYGEELAEAFESFTVDYSDSGFRKGFTVISNMGSGSC